MKYEEYEVPIEIKKYLEKWNSYFESCRNITLEEKINSNQIEISVYYETKILEKCDLDFGYKYKEINDLDEKYGSTRKALRHLLDIGYKWFYLDKESKLYKTCIEVGNHIIHSPFKELNKKIFIIQNENKLFCILGLAYYPNNYIEVFFGYVGEIGKKTFKQTSIFDYLEAY